jgi:hypothetical protein
MDITEEQMGASKREADCTRATEMAKKHGQRACDLCLV